MTFLTVAKMLEKITHPDTFRVITIVFLVILSSIAFQGFNYLQAQIDDQKVQTIRSIERVETRVHQVEQQSIPRSEFLQIERRLDQYFEQLDKRLDRIEARL